MSDATNKPQTVGLIGIGLLGSAIAHRLIGAGFTTWGHDPSPQALSAFSAIGGQPIMKLNDVPSASHSIILCLPNTDVVEEVLDAVTPRLRPGSIVIDTTTGDPERTRRLAGLLAAADVSLIDVSVLASSVITQEGNALLMVGSSSAVLLEVRHVLEAISERIHHVGPVGAGQEMKLVANLVLGLNRAVLAEGLHFARTFSLDQEVVLQILTSGVAYSKVMDTKGRKMLDEDFVPQARLSQHLKDVRLILEYAKDAQTALPLSNIHRDLLEKAEAAGNGDLDNSSIIRAWQ
jgi:3-hydroxyisobutyrate dehydrogenase-like beta-hydroxyacid dehydrogenase